MAYKILAIDDHPETLDIIVTTLRSNGFKVVGSQSPLKGLSLAEKMQPDLVLVDMNMPEIDGKEVCRRLRAHPQLSTVPIIMFTAEAEAYQKVEGFDAGADDYLTKPTEPEEMIARIEAMLASAGKVPQPDSDVEQIVSEPAGAAEVDDFDALFAETPEPPTATTSLPVQDKLIAVLSARGGAGATTVAINLAASIAMFGLSTTLVDLDMMQGHIALYLNQHIPSGGLNALAQLPEAAMTQQLPKLLAPYSDNLNLLLSRPNLDGRYPTLSPSQATGMVEQLTQPGHVVVVDMGRGITKMTRPVLDHADYVLVCVRPERIALASAKMLLQQLRETLFPHTTLSALVFGVGSSINLPQDAIQSFLGHPLLGIASIDLKLMARATNKGVPLVQMAPDSETTNLFLQLTNKMVMA